MTPKPDGTPDFPRKVTYLRAVISIPTNLVNLGLRISYSLFPLSSYHHPRYSLHGSGSTMDAENSPDRRASSASSLLPLYQLDPNPIESPPVDYPSNYRRDLGPSSQDGDDGFEMVEAEGKLEDSEATIKAPSTGAPGLSSSANLTNTSSSSTTGASTGPGPIFYCKHH